jgi:hypothetical protein
MVQAKARDQKTRIEILLREKFWGGYSHGTNEKNGSVFLCVHLSRFFPSG